MNERQPLLVPEYMQKFACIGGDCEDTCCAGFRVPIDYATYNKYLTITDSTLQTIISKSVKKNTDFASDKSFATIEVDEHHRCSFLNESGWCKMQMSQGEDALGLICHTFPRVVNVIDDVLEQSASTSCPEIARLALLNKQGIRFVESDTAADERHNIGIRLDTANKISNEKSAKHPEALDFFWDFRLFSINTLQNRQYSVTERLLILALFFQKADAAIAGGQSSSLGQLVTQYDEFSQSGAFKQALLKMPVNKEWHFHLLSDLFQSRNNFPITNQRFRARYQLITDHLDLRSEYRNHERYTSVCAKWEPIFTAHYDYIFENYLVNFVYKNIFPFRGYRTLQEEYMMLVVHYAMIRFMTFTLADVAEANEEPFNEDDLIACIQTYSKEIEHNAVFIKYLYDTLLLNQCNEIAKLSMLLRG